MDIKETFSVRVDMNIDLPEGAKVLDGKEKCAIIDRVHGYLTSIGTTSEDFEGGLAGKIDPLGTQFELLVTEVKPSDPTEVTPVFSRSTTLAEFKRAQSGSGYATFAVDVGTVQDVAMLGSVDALNEACVDDVFEHGHLMEDIFTELHGVSTTGNILVKVTAHVDQFLAEWEED